MSVFTRENMVTIILFVCLLTICQGEAGLNPLGIIGFIAFILYLSL